MQNRIRRTFGRYGVTARDSTFIRLQCRLATTLGVGVGFYVAVAYILNEPSSRVIPVVTVIAISWISFLVASSLLWFGIPRLLPHLPLWLYYFGTLRVFALCDSWSTKRGVRSVVASLILRRSSYADRQRMRDINRSMQSVAGLRRQRPLFVLRKHLMQKLFWKDWTFAIVAILGDKKVRLLETESLGERQQTLDVDLRNESYGVYSNAGKRFLRKTIADDALDSQLLSQANRFHRALSTGIMPEPELVWSSYGARLPLRWASGGFLPIAYFKQKYWAVLFFRDIYPIGLNLACGASETKAEYKDLNHLIGREFSEELVLVNGLPRTGHLVLQYPFTCASHGVPGDSMKSYLNPAFALRHVQLRGSHDGIAIDIAGNRSRRLRPADTPFSVRVKYHLPGLRESSESLTQDVLLSVNPAELGIEVISVCTFQLRPGEFLLDGEFDLGRGFLIRRPIILLDMEFLRSRFDEMGSLGRQLDDQAAGEGKRLGAVLPEHYEVFGDTLELREGRLMRVRAQLKQARLSRWERANLETEGHLLEQWGQTFAQTLQSVASKSVALPPPLSDLCPVTWRSLEMIFSRKLHYTLPE